MREQILSININGIICNTRRSSQGQVMCLPCPSPPHPTLKFVVKHEMSTNTSTVTPHTQTTANDCPTLFLGLKFYILITKLEPVQIGDLTRLIVYRRGQVIHQHDLESISEADMIITGLKGARRRLTASLGEATVVSNERGDSILFIVDRVPLSSPCNRRIHPYYQPAM